jgi:hypothetical protein
MATELHVLNDDYLERRAAGDDSREALLGTAERLYAQIVVAAANSKLPPPWGPMGFYRYLRWAWMVEGAAQYYAGHVPLFRAAVNTRMRQGKRPSFPPSARDAIILGGTVFDLLERERGRDACQVLASRLHRAGARGNLELAFDGRLAEIETEWRRYLREEVPRTGGFGDQDLLEAPPEFR